eukprot:jgi/Galph1/2874/GphlegSOOS_G1542.1
MAPGYNMSSQSPSNDSSNGENTSISQTAAEKLRQRLLQLQKIGSLESENTYKNRSKQGNEKFINKIENDEKYRQSTKTIKDSHTEMNNKNGKKLENGYLGRDSPENEIASLRQNLAKYIDLLPTLNSEKEENIEVSNKKDIKTSPEHGSPIYSTSINQQKAILSSSHHGVSIEETCESPNAGSYYSEDDNQNSPFEEHLKNVQKRLISTKEEYESILERMQAGCFSSMELQTPMRNAEEEERVSQTNSRLVCPLHELFSFSTPCIQKLRDYIQSFHEDDLPVVIRLIQHSTVNEMHEMIFFCLDQYIQKEEEGQENIRKAQPLLDELEQLDWKYKEEIKRQQEVGEKLREALETCQAKLCRTQLELEVAQMEKLQLENCIPTLEVCEELEARVEKLEKHRDHHENELHNQLREKNLVIEELKRQLVHEDNEIGRLYLEIEDLLEQVESIRSSWDTKKRLSSNSNTMDTAVFQGLTSFRLLV